MFTPPQILDGPRWRNMRVGLLGGSFNPPHAGHLHISETAMKRLGLDCVWWLVTPQNPLKDSAQTLPFERRMTLCEALCARHPRILVSDLENRMGSVRTIQTVSGLRSMFPATDFVLLAGTDILPQFHRWHRWRDIPDQIAMAFIARPPAASLIRQNAMSLLGRQNHHIRLSHGGKPPLKPGHCYWILEGPNNRLSSTEIRNNEQ